MVTGHFFIANLHMPVYHRWQYQKRNERTPCFPNLVQDKNCVNESHISGKSAPVLLLRTFISDPFLLGTYVAVCGNMTTFYFLFSLSFLARRSVSIFFSLLRECGSTSLHAPSFPSFSFLFLSSFAEKILRGRKKVRIRIRISQLWNKGTLLYFKPLLIFTVQVCHVDQYLGPV